MIHSYIGRNRKLCLRPVDPEGEEELRELLQQFKQLGLEAIDVETEMPEEQYQHYKRTGQRRAGGEYSGNKQFGFSPQSYFPMPPDFSPQMHYMPPMILPIWFGQDRGGNYGDHGGGARSIFDKIERAERDYGTTPENPRDTGRGDTRRR